MVVSFDDLLMIRKGGARMTLGHGATTVEPISTSEQWAEKAAALREIYFGLLGQRPAIECPLDVRLEGEEDCGDYVERRVSYNVEPDERVTSLALIPKSQRTPLPGVLCIHQTQAVGKLEPAGRDAQGRRLEAPGDMAYALEAVRRGYVAFAPDLLGSGERLPEAGRKYMDNHRLYERHPQWSGVGKDLWDMGRALDVLCSLPEVDGSRIGSMGHSQGGGITLNLLAFEPRVKAGVSSCGFMPWRTVKNPFNAARTGWWIGIPALRPYCVTGKNFPVDAHEVAAMGAPKPFLSISALNDWTFTPEEQPGVRAQLENFERNVNAVYTLLGRPGGFELMLHEAGHGFPGFARGRAFEFLDSVLKRNGENVTERRELRTEN